MGNLHQLRAQLLRDGKITRDEVEVVRDYIEHDGQLDMDDVKFLVELLSEADEVCDAFDELFFPALKHVLLDDGQIGMDEQYYLMKMLYADGHVRDSERQFLQELRGELKQTTPAFEMLYETAMQAPSKNWEL